MNLRSGLLIFFFMMFVLLTIYNIYTEIMSDNIADSLGGFYSLSVPMLALAFYPDSIDKSSRSVRVFVYRLLIFVYAVVLFSFMIKYHASWFLLFFEGVMVLVTGVLVYSTFRRLIQIEK
ncbi:hypothetical protein [Macrococcoides caseolyticum]|uniref:hypothetical protein n=1 Tax=Macrococcoides caseolyticum TaxID=69966 RepID=UPI000C3368ED|nr:hypothetical protein [Macrococcus caseolyticus]PKE11723.1 hypothetical protein CW685_06515 [Macrococcus caseolyticus]PKE44508.1 hypothetical protein CW666_04610 [Macrococcus caseolyticus]PKE46918.1 hypothetical protein CW677_10240 [Macrococcus caseolyticus]PKE62568.1 hypothetical protein CW683_09760 [Macrococcus caseolyticus]PKF13580.1 hypothetical protein CW690_10235 [Macrococcus caseolyticus]